MNAAAARGEISKKTVDEFNKASKGMKLPERIGKKKNFNKLRKMFQGGQY